MKGTIAALIGMAVVAVGVLLAMWLNATNVLAKINAPSADEVASCQRLIDGFTDTIRSAPPDERPALKMQSALHYSTTDCADVMERARVAGEAH